MLTTRFRNILPAALALLALAAPLHAQTTSRSSSSSNRATTTTSPRPASTGYTGSTGANGTRQYRSNTLLGDALIQVDPESRSLVVVTDEETHAAVSKIIENLDHPKPQVLIKVVFVEVSLDKDLDVGLEGSYTFKAGRGIPATTGNTSTTKTKTVTANGATTQTVTTSTSALTSANSGTGVAETLFGLANQTAGTFAKINAADWSATLHLLAQNGKAQVLSRPSIMARNNQEAVIVVGKEVPMITNSQITTEGQTINTIKYQDVGIILRVTPFITSDKTVEMIVAPEISSLSDQTVPISSNASAPVINKRSAETVVVTPNATTVVIGGLMQKESTSTIQKVPILGDIPILGLPFRRTVKSESRSELLIFLTPYIIESTQKLNEVTLNEANRAELSRNGISPEDIRNNLDTLRLMPELDANPPAPAPSPKKK